MFSNCGARISAPQSFKVLILIVCRYFIMSSCWNKISTILANAIRARTTVNRITSQLLFSQNNSITFLCRCNHGKTKSARIQKRNVFSTDKNEM